MKMKQRIIIFLLKLNKNVKTVTKFYNGYFRSWFIHIDNGKVIPISESELKFSNLKRLKELIKEESED